MKFLITTMTCVFLLTSCTGSYSESKCEGRLRSLKGIEGKYDLSVDGENQDFSFQIVRSGIGSYDLLSDGAKTGELSSCVINKKEILELTSDGIVMPFVRANRNFSSVNFDKNILDAEGITYETATLSQLDMELVSVTGEISDAVFIRAVKKGPLNFIKR